MRTLGTGLTAAIALAAAMTSANAQGVWIGAPGFGVGVGPTPYYSGYRGSPCSCARYAYYGYEPNYAYQTYAYEPEYGYDSYTYVPDDGYVAYSYGPRPDTYAYDANYGYAPQLRYAYSPGDRVTRGYAYADTRGVTRDRGHRSTMVHHTRVQHHAVTRNGFTVGAERENAGSKRIRPEASKALARGSARDLRKSKSIEARKTGKGETH